MSQIFDSKYVCKNILMQWTMPIVQDLLPLDKIPLLHHW